MFSINFFVFYASTSIIDLDDLPFGTQFEKDDLIEEDDSEVELTGTSISGWFPGFKCWKWDNKAKFVIEGKKEFKHYWWSEWITKSQVSTAVKI